MKPEYDILTFTDGSSWRNWLAANHASCDGVWLKFYKKSSGQPTITYAEALDNALCYGWIDGQAKSLDDVSFLQKYTPRRARSIWSKRNIAYAERLIGAGLMTEAGLAEITRAKVDGRWQQAYDSPRNMVMPADFLAALERNQPAKAFFATLTRSQTYIIGFQLQTAKKAETRERRIAKFISMLEQGEKPR